MKISNYILAILFLASCSQSKNIHLVKYDYLESLNCDYKFNQEINNYFIHTKDVGMAATDYCLVSEHQKLINTLISKDTINEINANTFKKIQNEYSKIDAKEYIIKKSKDHDFLLINEAHYIPQHRNFLSSLLPELYNQGYCNLALEGLNPAPQVEKEIANNGYLNLFHGYYTLDPEFGNLIRKAHKLGFNIFGYNSGSGAEREINGARNILEKIQSYKKKGKTIVLCGWDHIKEGPTGNYWEYALAGRIKEFSGKDPLTINQTQYYERAQSIYEDSLYQSLNTQTPVVLINKSDQPLDLEANKEWYDIFVIHPRTKFIEGIPDWILKEKTLRTFDLPKVDIQYPCKLLIFEKDDNFQSAVPVYIAEINESQKTIKAPVYDHKKYKLLIANKELAYLIE